MRRVTVRAPDIIAPVFTTTEIVVLLFPGVTGKTSLSNRLGRFVLERNDLRRVAVFYVRFAGAVTRLTTSNFSLPTADGGEFSMRRVREGFELIFVAILAGIATHVAGVSRRRNRRLRLILLKADGLRSLG